MTIFLGIVTVPLLALLGFLVVEVVAALFGPRPRAVIAGWRRPRTAVLIPAHNEGHGIAVTLAGIVHQLQAGDRCIVVADNCEDNTVAVAADFGVEVLERRDATRRGKGYALDRGLQYLRTNPPDVVVIIDADCTIVAGAIAQLAGEADATGGPVQGCNLLEPPFGSGLRARLSAFAFRFKNHVRALGLRNLRGPCLLFGTGMAFPWRVLANTSLATGNSVEDMQMGVDLALAGHPARYCAIPCVSGLLPNSPAVAAAQRRRWEHGHLRTLLTQVPRLMVAALTRCRPDLLLLACDLAVPPLSLLALLCAAGTALNPAAWIVADDGVWLAVLLAAEALAVTALLVAWSRFARDCVSWLDLVGLPIYVLCKVPLYLSAIVRPQRSWTRVQPAAPNGAQVVDSKLEKVLGHECSE